MPVEILLWNVSMSGSSTLDPSNFAKEPFLFICSSTYLGEKNRIGGQIA